MADLTPHALIQSFVGGLSDFLTTLVAPSTSQTRSLTMTALTGITQTFTADRDYHVQGWMFVGNTGNGWQVGIDSANKFIGGVSENTLDNVIVGARSAGTGTLSTMSGLRIPVKSGQKIYLQNNTAATQSIVLYLEY